MPVKIVFDGEPSIGACASVGKVDFFWKMLFMTLATESVTLKI